ncbi:MAG TPA: isocitrate lyase/phosphoenolpyruvate mutase family protein [Polyangia bacterium]|jgi:2-methylisocitrate lyase-like PEP mutase family enzyme
MSRTTAEKRSAFRALHASGCFVLPNPWDVGTARMMQHLGFPALDKLVAFAEAGADCLYAPAVRAPEDITAMVRAVAPKPVNVLMMRPGLGVAALADLGVRRISVGGALARVAWGAVLAAARQMLAGSFDGLGGGG